LIWSHKTSAFGLLLGFDPSKCTPSVICQIFEMRPNYLFSGFSMGFFFHPEASAPWMVKGEALCS